MRAYHVNLLKSWKEREGLMITLYPPEPELEPLADEPTELRPVAIGQELNVEQ